MFDAMDTTGLDTLKATRTLEAAGFETSQAEALVSVFGGPVAGNAATKGDVREFRSEVKTEIRDLRTELKTEISQLRDETKAEIADCRTELKAEIADCRTELKAEIADCRAEIAGLRDEANAKFVKLHDELKVESAERRADITKVSREIADVREDIKNLKAQMYRLLLVQATVIVALIVGLQRLL